MKWQRRWKALYFYLRCWKHLSRLSHKRIQEEIKCIQKNVNGFVLCEEEWNPFIEEDCEDLWSCPNANRKLKSSFPSPNVLEDDSEGKENVKPSSLSDFPNKLPAEKTNFDLIC